MTTRRVILLLLMALLIALLVNNLAQAITDSEHMPAYDHDLPAGTVEYGDE